MGKKWTTSCLRMSLLALCVKAVSPGKRSWRPTKSFEATDSLLRKFRVSRTFAPTVSPVPNPGHLGGGIAFAIVYKSTIQYAAARRGWMLSTRSVLSLFSFPGEHSSLGIWDKGSDDRGALFEARM
jgi:hypothetical protein